MKAFIVCVSAALAVVTSGFVSAQSCRYTTPPKKMVKGEKARQEGGYDIFLLIGQSNMAGRAPMTGEDTTRIIPGVWLLNGDDVPEKAKNPLNRYSTVRKDRNKNVYSNQKINPGTAFGEIIAAETGRKVLLVVNAMGETTIEEWAKDAPLIKLSSSIGKDKLQLYSEAVRRCREAMKYGTLKGIIWHQGEGNATESGIKKYPAQLMNLVSNLRMDLDAPEVPFIAGEISYLRKGEWSAVFNEMLHTIPEFIYKSAWVSSEGLPTLDPLTSSKRKPDWTHFNREGQLELGKRYAEKAIEMCYPDRK